MGARVQTLKSIFTAETGPAEAGFRRMKSETQSFGQGAAQVFDGMGVGLKQFAGAAGLGAVAVAIGKTAIDLERMREESAQMEARFVGFTGGTRQAEAAMRAFDEALGNAMTNDQKMATAAQLMGLGIAGTAEEAATLTRQAMVLGIGIDELSQALESGRINGLIKYGIAASDVKKKAQELQAANSSLTASEATAIAVKEALAEQSRKIEQNGGEAATAITEIGNAWEDLKDAAADKVNLEVAIRGGAETMNFITAVLRGPAPDAAQAVEESSRESEVQNAKRELAEAMQARADYYQQLERMRQQAEKNGRILPEGFDSDLVLFDERVAKAQAALNDLNIELALAAARRGAESGSSMLRIGEAVDGALAKAKAAVGGVNAELAESQKYWDAWAGFAEAAGARAAAAAMTAWAQARGGGGARSLDDWMARDQAAVNAAAAARGARGNQTYSYVQGYDPVSAFNARQDARRREAEEQQRENERLAKAAAKDWQSEMESAVREWQGSFRGAMDGAISDSIGLKSLLPGGDKGPNAPGANGFAEDIFRLQAFVNDGTWGETAQKHGLDKAGATEVIKKFQSGQWDESVLKVLDMDKLKEQIKQQKIAKGMMDQLAADLAAETQGDPKLIKAMLGLGGGGDGGKGSGGGAGGAAAAGMDMSAFSASFLAGVDAELAKSKGDYEKRGVALWDALGGGFVKAAGKSAAFKAAVTALVDEAMADNLS